MDKRKLVVTYQYAYVRGEIALCDACADNPAITGPLPALGPVSHGAHRAYCDGCDGAVVSKPDPAVYLSTSEGAWRVIHRGLPLCADTDRLQAIMCALAYGYREASLPIWDGDIGAWRAVCPRCLGIEPGIPGGTPEIAHPGPFAPDLCGACDRATSWPVVEMTSPHGVTGTPPAPADDDGGGNLAAIRTALDDSDDGSES